MTIETIKERLDELRERTRCQKRDFEYVGKIEWRWITNNFDVVVTVLDLLQSEVEQLKGQLSGNSGVFNFFPAGTKEVEYTEEDGEPVADKPVDDVGEGYREATIADVGKPVEVRDETHSMWKQRMLREVDCSKKDFKYICGIDGNKNTDLYWRYARIKCDTPAVKPTREPRECIGTEDHDGSWQVNVQVFESGSRTNTNPAKYKRVIKFREVFD